MADNTAIITRARLVQIAWDDKQQTANEVPGGKTVEVQFNPQTLRLSYANETKGGDQPGGSAKQFVGSGTTKLSVELLFDTTEETGADNRRDVRHKTEAVAFFLKAEKQKQQKGKRPPPRVPPGIRFEWGTFIFRGVVTSMQETLDYFSEEGIPMRATLALELARQEIEFEFGKPGAASPTPGVPLGAPGAGTPGTDPGVGARDGESLQQLASRVGSSADWKAIATLNNIDNPLRLGAGIRLNVDLSGSASAGVSAGASSRATASVSASTGVSASAGVSGGFAAGARGSFGGG